MGDVRWGVGVVGLEFDVGDEGLEGGCDVLIVLWVFLFVRFVLWIEADFVIVGFPSFERCYCAEDG